jgi:hypothetical protein
MKNIVLLLLDILVIIKGISVADLDADPDPAFHMQTQSGYDLTL